MNRKQRKSKQRRKVRWGRVSLVFMALLIAGGGTWIYYIYHNLKNTVDQDVHESVASIDNEITKGKVKDQEPLNILLLGVDERANDRGRSDTMIVLTLDPNNERMQMVSIPRDTRTEIIGRGTTDKINHSYAFGGSDMAVNTVENFLDIEIDYFSTVNMEGLEQLVDSVDGVTVDNDLAFSNGRFDFPEGELYLDGREALAYVRMRKDDPQGDAGRNERQRQVIEGVLSKGASFSSMNKFHDILDVLGDNVSTNMDFSDMRTLATDYRGARKTIDTYQVEGDGTYIGDVWYLLVPDGEVQKVHHMIKDYPDKL
ncbi:LCP family glycopolymer transferase [Halobacillus sp. B23F22_1]|uniref:LCP family glycopolymer transferase n=1 Tax=Halobacillus sp. B23F22_1 TaxID=3459514 RepID=UPI00373EC2D1